MKVGGQILYNVPSIREQRLTNASTKERSEAKLQSVLAQRCEHKLQERVAHVRDNVCVRLSTQSNAHNTEEN